MGPGVSHMTWSQDAAALNASEHPGASGQRQPMISQLGHHHHSCPSCISPIPNPPTYTYASPRTTKYEYQGPEPHAMDDDFGFDSADEADLLAAVDGVNPAAKRRNEDPSGQQEPTSKRQRASDNTNVAERVLNERFGLKSFRLEQKAAINRLLDGDSAVVVFPTGGGKSLCYQ
ncbi:hypothetical protein CH063_01608, partial [Colletotrichum higginsianum]